MHIDRFTFFIFLPCPLFSWQQKWALCQLLCLCPLLVCQLTKCRALAAWSTSKGVAIATSSWRTKIGHSTTLSQPTAALFMHAHPLTHIINHAKSLSHSVPNRHAMRPRAASRTNLSSTATPPSVARTLVQCCERNRNSTRTTCRAMFCFVRSRSCNAIH